jgi:amino acid transporter
MDVSRVVGGPLLFKAMAGILILANLGCGMSAQAGVSRLLFGMGRDNVLPKAMFAYLDPKRNTPLFNILLIGVLAFLGALFLNYEQAAELINFGAFLAFMGVNLATIRQYWFGGKSISGRRLLGDFVVPLAGFLFCFAIWLSLPKPAKIAGGLWLLVGGLYDAAKTRGFRVSPAMIDFGES